MSKLTEEEVQVRKSTKVELDKKLKTALRTIDKKIHTLYGCTPEEIKYITNGSFFKMNENDTGTVNVLATTNVNYLLLALAKMKRLKREYEEQMNELNIKTAPQLMWCYHSVDSWISDITLRTKLIVHADTISALYAAKEELTTYLSKEDKLEATLNNISDLLKS